MNQPVFCMLLGWLFLCFFTATVAQPVEKEFLTLPSGAISFTPKAFYIAGVIDERKESPSLGYLLLPRSNTSQPVVTYPVGLEGGTATAIGQFIRQSMASNEALYPIIFRIKECVITEIPGSSGRVEGRVVLTVAFDLQKDGERFQLLEYYRGGAHYNRPANSRSHVPVESALQKSVVSALKYLNTWMHEEAEGHPLLAKEIKIAFADYTENVYEDTVYYDPDRPLRWSDFRERPRVERYAASVFPSFGYESRSEVLDGILYIHVTMKVYMIPNYSWVKSHARDAYSLNHEQKHFDIAKLVSERFKQQIRDTTVTADNYNNILQWEYIASYREMNRLQEQYDDETGHGTNRAAQQRWNRYIDEKLRSLGVKQQKVQ